MREADIAINWNNFVRTLISAEKLWEKHRANMAGIRQIDGLSPKARKVLASVTNRSKFDVALPRLTDQWRQNGGLNELLVDIPKNANIKKDIKNDETATTLRK
jgi:hypothetical protein